MRLDGEDVDRLSDALRAAFTPAELRQFVRTRLDRNLDDITLANTYVSQVFDLIEDAERDDRIPELLAAAHEARPSSGAIQGLAAQIGSAAAVSEIIPGGTQPANTAALERIITKTNALLDIEEFRARLSAIEATVCRIELNVGSSASYGTGFLVGQDLVITNYHVIEPALSKVDGAAAPEPPDLRLRFDYKRSADNSVINPGQVARPAKAWLYDSSPMSNGEARGKDDGPPPRPDELDYAVIRLSEQLGTKAIGSRTDEGDPLRGWIPLVPPARSPTTGDPLFIVQHPEAEPMQVALDTDAVLGENANHTRLQYRTNTLPGSSGSPCFDQHWNLVALHHYGDPNYWPWHHGAYNQGIPVGRIVELLQARGLASELLQPRPGA
jgi:hypothetical protein